ncbi:prepilin-type N-terminal cleavage/methylation domain-containing protein [Roseovarius sp. MBR-79]|jgi:prepilin-type N-terminal cleavage/methylation domain-containing protein
MGRVRHGGAAGFSLLEMVVVVAVMATLTLAATLSVGRRSGPSDAAHFAEAYGALMDAALLGQEARGLRVMSGGWQVLRPVAPGQGWQSSGPVQKFRDAVVFEGTDGPILARERPDPPVPDLVFLPDGKLTPVTVRFTTGGVVTLCRAVPLAGLDCGAQ